MNPLCLRWLVGVKAQERFFASASYGISPFQALRAEGGVGA